MYLRQVTVMLGLITLCMVLLGAGFFSLSYRHQLEEIKTTLDRNASYISSYANTAITKGDSLTGEDFISYIHWEALVACLRAQGTTMIERTATDDFEPLWDGLSIRLFGMDKTRMEERRRQFAEFCAETDPERQLTQMRAFDSTENQCSLACCLQTADGWKAFLTGDLCSGWDERCAKTDFPRAQVLKLTHHGQKDGMPQSLVDACDPEIFVMCADADRTFNSACDAVCLRAREYLNARNRPTQIYTTGLLENAFGTQNDRIPCALRCCPGAAADAYFSEGSL